MICLIAPQLSANKSTTLHDDIVEVLRQYHASVSNSVVKLTRDGYMTEQDCERIRWQLHCALLETAYRFSYDVMVSVVINCPNVAQGEALCADCKVVADGSLVWPPLTVW